MLLNIVFGWHLDGLSFPETINGIGCDEFGTLIVGPAGLSQALALRLGIVRPLVPQAVRIARYMKALEGFNDGNQFFSKSFELDAWSTSSRLLVLRDELIAAGWNGKYTNQSTPKLRTLEIAEQLIFPLGSASEILRDILCKSQTQTFRRLPIKSISIVGSKALLPETWRRIFDYLEASGIIIREIGSQRNFPKDTDLGKVQQFLVSRENTELNNDGSITILEADDQFQLAEVAACWLKANSDLENLVLLRDASTPILDSYCQQYALPRIGGHKASRWRSVLQVLPLMFQTCWLPANPYRTLELLSLPQGPIPKSLGYFFIQALRKEPGFRSDSWALAWQQASEKLAGESEVPDDLRSTRPPDFAKSLRFWLEPDRHDSKLGMPIEQALTICRQVRKWAAANIREERSNELLVRAITFAHELEDALITTGLTRVSQITLNRMIEAVAGEGCKPEQWRAEASFWSSIDHPGQLWGTTHSLLWWGFNERADLFVQPSTWSTLERQILDSQGVHLESKTANILRQASSWKQALLNVSSEVLICRSRTEKGHPSRAHPLWHEIEPIVRAAPKGLVTQAHTVLSEQNPVIGKKRLPLSSIETKKLPKAQRIWTAPPGQIFQRNTESVTSMRELLGCPMAWVLRYRAQLHPGILLSLPSGDTLIGDIAHKVFRKIFESAELRDKPEAVRTRAKVIFDHLVETAGLPLLLRGQAVARENAKESIAKAAEQFSIFLCDAQYDVVACEARFSAPFGDGHFTGDMDTVLKDLDGNLFIVDFKWNKFMKYRVEEITRGHHLQLFAYAWLQTVSTGQVPRVGYYMLRQRRLIHCGGDSTLDFGEFVPSAPHLEYWTRAESTYFHEIETLKSGIICASGIPVAESPAKSADQLFLDPPCKFCTYGNICGLKGSTDG